MSCLDELTCSIYADGELSPEETRRVEFHLASCQECRELVEGLAGEARLLARVVEELVPTPAALPALVRRGMPLTWIGVTVLACITSLRVFFGLVSGLAPVASGDWLNPLSISGQTNLFFSTVFHLFEEGTAVLFIAVPVVLASMALCAAAALLYGSRRGLQPAAAG